MTAMFPDSGVPASDARNSLPDAQVASVHCQELWYSTSRCQPRFDPAAANAVLAELVSLINKGEVIYDCNYLDQVQLAVRRIDQRSLPQYCPCSGSSPNMYECYPDPPATRYNDGMVLTIVPHANNINGAYVNVSGLGFVQILRPRTRGALLANDLRASTPARIVFFGGYFWLVGSGVVFSDIPDIGTVPRVMTSDIDAWVRTDGNDDTGDGTSNDAAHAFRTIQGAWRKLGALYIASPIYAINIRLGIPGEYTGASFVGYGGVVRVFGDQGNPGGYRIMPMAPGPGGIYAGCFNSVGMTSLGFWYLTIVMKGYPEGSGVQMYGIASFTGANTTYTQCDFSVESDSSSTIVNWVRDANMYFFGNNHYYGNGNRVMIPVYVKSGRFEQASPVVPATMNWVNFNIQQAGFVVHDLGYLMLEGTTLAESGNTGPRYIASFNSVMKLNAQNPPGNTAGSSSSGAVVAP